MNPPRYSATRALELAESAAAIDKACAARGAVTSYEKGTVALKVAADSIYEVMQKAAAQTFPDDSPSIALGKWLGTEGGRAAYALYDRFLRSA